MHTGGDQTLGSLTVPSRCRNLAANGDVRV